MTVVCTLVLFGLLLSVAIVDFRHQYIPDEVNAALAIVGVAQAVFLGEPSLLDGLIGSATGAGLFLAIRAAYGRLRGRVGLGLGDVKFMAAAGLWVGWNGLAPLILIATISALLYVGVRTFGRKPIGAVDRIPFGPFLAFGTACVWTMASA
jgi:leader peptidase (prepilin peptidase)/N-methyltransferase